MDKSVVRTFFKLSKLVCNNVYMSCIIPWGNTTPDSETLFCMLRHYAVPFNGELNIWTFL